MNLTKGVYHDADDNVIGSVKFNTHPDGSAEDVNVIYENGPSGWKCCCWDEGTVENNKKPSKKAKKEEKDIEITVEDNGDLDDDKY
mgnify:FL=1